jgi:hypothetical protein
MGRLEPGMDVVTAIVILRSKATKNPVGGEVYTCTTPPPVTFASLSMTGRRTQYDKLKAQGDKM